ncbi:hypothetical protein PGH47_27175 [Streptomyces sp. HUAS 31]|uniref:hypothetical protein n=1 Tax=Streptomyces sp. HUAS 31 TaxID=3020055 RepID=UPI002306158D|nr:hypothetical protein [Streptomyces sp. HUAS 31]WCD99143.1 hypothetical protein PGH47_27175 [Streptomyces sp. HUAS 31]
MEQRIGSGSQPLEGAGFDPAFIPGLTSPASVAPKGAKKEDAAGEADSEETALDDADEPGTEAADGIDDIDDADDDAEDAVDEADEADDEDDEEDAPVDGPVFEAADRRARIAVDHKGVRLTLDDQECEFRWDEIGAIETESPRFGKRYTITVHTPDRRWYPIEIEATARARFKEWDEQLDAVLDAYFEESD